MLNILFLPRWYPHRYDPMPGLFIQRQAEAIAANYRVVVLYVHPDPDCPSEFEIDVASENGVTIVRVYYKIPEIVLPGVYHLMNLTSFYKAHYRGLEVVGDFTPDIVHSHILTREAVMGHLLSRKYNVPHIISEHWSRYFQENGTYRGNVRKFISGYVVRKASAVIAVSEMLKTAMISCGLVHGNYFVVPNVVDSPLKIDAKKRDTENRKVFLHVSCFDDRAKNISGLLKVLSVLSKNRTDFQCLLVGEGPDLAEMKHLANILGLTEKSVIFVGLKEEQELNLLYAEADFTVLSSHYETFGTVIAESLGCGTPVLSTSVGIAPEIITTENGILIPANDTRALAEGINRMLDICDTFERDNVRATILDRYTPEIVNQQLSEIYSQVRGDV
jgi:glycosyltransferase involved in cell wall biosynthesis